jgi:hypothetical protein
MTAIGHERFLGHAVAQMVEAPCYKPEGRGFQSRRDHWIFKFTSLFEPYYGPTVYSASKRNEYQEYSWEVKRGRNRNLTTSPTSVGRLTAIALLLPAFPHKSQWRGVEFIWHWYNFTFLPSRRVVTLPADPVFSLTVQCRGFRTLLR